jgi:PAS domain S-box-containing protein
MREKGDDLWRQDLEHPYNAIQLVLEHSPTVFFTRDETDDVFTFVSDNVNIFGYKPKAFYSPKFDFNALIHADDRERIASERRRSLAGKAKKYSLEYRLLSKTDSVQWIEEKGYIDRSPDGAALLTRGVLIDCTERKHAEQILHGLVSELKSSIAETETLHRAKTDLIHILAHDLKNPLSAVMLMVDLLLKKHVDMPVEAVNKRLSNIKDALLRMRDIIDNVLVGSSHYVQFSHLNLEPVGLANCIESVVSSCEPLAAAKRIRLVVDADKRVPKAKCDRVAALQILENLISNAVKFSPFDSEVHIRLSAVGEFVRISVCDQGPGLSDDDKQKLFQKFAKLSAKPTGGESSTGVGLSIVKSYVDAMNGRIWCESELGNGATFIVELPAANESVPLESAPQHIENAS